VLEVLKVANFLAVTCVLDGARTFLAANLRPCNALRVAGLAEAAGLTDARASAIEFVVSHFDALVAAPGACGITRLDRASLAQLLASDALRVESELTVFRTLMAWLDASEEEAPAPAPAPAPPPSPPREGQRESAPPSPARAAGAAQPCPHDLLQLVRMQHIPLEQLFREVAQHPRLQTMFAAQLVSATFAFHALHPDAKSEQDPPAAPPPRPFPPLMPQPPRRYSLVDPAVVRLSVLLKVREGEELVRQLCESLPVRGPRRANSWAGADARARAGGRADQVCVAHAGHHRADGGADGQEPAGQPQAAL